MSGDSPGQADWRGGACWNHQAGVEESSGDSGRLRGCGEIPETAMGGKADRESRFFSQCYSTFFSISRTDPSLPVLVQIASNVVNARVFVPTMLYQIFPEFAPGMFQAISSLLPGIQVLLIRPDLHRWAVLSRRDEEQWQREPNRQNAGVPLSGSRDYARGIAQ